MSRTYAQCFICRQWSWDASWTNLEVRLCLPCYVDVLEVRQGRQERGLMAEPSGGPMNSQASGANIAGKSPAPFTQMEMFEDLDRHEPNQAASLRRLQDPHRPI